MVASWCEISKHSHERLDREAENRAGLDEPDGPGRLPSCGQKHKRERTKGCHVRCTRLGNSGGEWRWLEHAPMHGKGICFVAELRPLCARRSQRLVVEPNGRQTRQLMAVCLYASCTSPTAISSPPLPYSPSEFPFAFI